MKNIALIRNSYPRDIGGAEIFPISLAKILSQDQYKPIVLSANIKTLEMAKTAKLNIAHSPWWALQNLSGLRILLFPVYLIWILFVTIWYVVFFIRNHIDIAHPQSRDDFISATLAAKLLNKKVVWTDHADLKHIYRNHKVFYKNPIGKLVFFTSKLADHITIESYSEKRLIEESLGKKLPSNYKVIYIGVVDNYRPVKRTNNVLVLVSTSRLVKDKGIVELIEAFKLIHNPRVILKICGDGPDVNYFKSIASNIKNIKFLGHIDDITQVLLNSDVLVHPTYHEGFGLSLVEAEMCKLPIIASKVGSIPEIVEDGVSGILVPPKNIESLAEAINRMINDSYLRSKMGKAGRQIFLKNFQFNLIVSEKYLPLYE